MSTLPVGYGEVLLQWEAPEHEPLELGPRSRIIVTVLLIIVIAYALITNSPLMAITFILVGVVGYLSMHREQKIISFLLTSQGVIAGKEFYPFDEIHSFWIYTESPFDGLLSLHTTGKLVPYIHIPTVTVDTEILRETLAAFLPEEKHEPGLVDTLERLLHI